MIIQELSDVDAMPARIGPIAAEAAIIELAERQCNMRAARSMARQECGVAGVVSAPAQDQPMLDTAFVSPDQIRSWFAIGSDGCDGTVRSP
ncbi:hypothetical protein [Xanthomonas euvesicatoria]|uniref:Uncharacterized protein n=1 Tax=Xanthomonas euvesicatoria TaxID=456327 RepID=A0AAX4FP86_XANEU|nr:hypothetical protein [Xanthomonas euvesicatoria]WOP58343.1 hypothetical protein R5577_09775 [Xanthomonas euvesicatoria]